MCSLQEPINANMVLCLCDGCMYQSMSLCYGWCNRSQLALVDHSFATWFIWHTDSDAFMWRICACMCQSSARRYLWFFWPTALTCHMFIGEHVVDRGSEWRTLDVLSCLKMWTQLALNNKGCLNIRVCVFHLEYKTFYTDAYIKLLCLMMESRTPVKVNNSSQDWQMQDASVVLVRRTEIKFVLTFTPPVGRMTLIQHTNHLWSLIYTLVWVMSCEKKVNFPLWFKNK